MMLVYEYERGFSSFYCHRTLYCICHKYASFWGISFLHVNLLMISKKSCSRKRFITDITSFILVFYRWNFYHNIRLRVDHHMFFQVVFSCKGSSTIFTVILFYGMTFHMSGQIVVLREGFWKFFAIKCFGVYSFGCRSLTLTI